MRIGYHASHEQFTPRELLAYAQQADLAGFDGVMSSEHIAPWSVRQGQSGFAWSWLGAALQATERASFGALAIPGGWRYHPVVVAHVFATLAQMFPNRLGWIAAGSGEAMNEIMVGQGWPPKQERNERLLTAVEMIRALWRGETVTRADGPIKAKNARLWTLPEATPKIYGAALSPATAAWMGGWADGLVTVCRPVHELQEIVDAFRQNGGKDKPMVLQLQLSWAESETQARENAHHQWRHIAADVEKDSLETPEAFDQNCAHIQPEEMDEQLLIASDAEKITGYIHEHAALGFDEVYIHNAGRNQGEFIEFFKKSVLPVLRK